MDGQERAVKASREVAWHVAQGRKALAADVAKQRQAVEEAEARLGRMEIAAEQAAAPPKPKAKCFVCQGEAQSGRSMGVNSLITGTTVLTHVQTGQQGGCWSIMQRARATILPHCKTGPKVHDKILGDRLLREEIDRMMTRPKFQAEVAGQWDPSYSLTAKTAEKIRLDHIENELRALRARLRGGQTGNELAQKADLATATETVDQRELSRYTDPDIEFNQSPATEEHYEGEHATENER